GVELVTEPIDRFVPEGIRLGDGTVRELDAVVFATGFASQDLVAPMRVEGPDGRTLDELWAGGPRAHLGITVAGMPNLFLLYGPNTNPGHNSILFMLERQFHYVVECLAALRRPRPRARARATRSLRPQSVASSNAPGAVPPARSHSAAEWPATAQNRDGRRRAMANAPKPPIDTPPIATRRGSACSRLIASGIAS